MKRNSFMLATALILMLTALPAGVRPAAAAVHTLRAAAGSVTMPDGRTVPFWGFGLYSTAAAPAPSLPGPTIVMNAGDTISLVNDLPVPVSLVIPGQLYAPPAAPINVDGRVMSFTTETAPGQTGSYSFINLKPGTFIYESGTNPATQIPMGLYGAVIVRPAGFNPAAMQAYTQAGSAFDSEQVVVFSEIDPDLNDYVSANNTAVDPVRKINHALQYVPRYYLVNGKSYPEGGDILAPVGQTTLLRLLNPANRNRMPTFQGSYLDNAVPPVQRSLGLKIIAEDGNFLTWPRYETVPILAAGKTLDALVDLTTATTPGYYPVYDRALGITNDISSPGGMITFIGSYGPGQNCSPLKGDLNGDGKVSPVDVLNALRAYVQGTSNLATMDVTPEPMTGLPCGDGTFDLTDVLLMLRKSLSLASY